MKTKTLLSLAGIIVGCGFMCSSIDNPKKIFESERKRNQIYAKNSKKREK